MGNGPVDGLNHVRHGSAAVVVEGPDRHNTDVWGDEVDDTRYHGAVSKARGDSFDERRGLLVDERRGLLVHEGRGFLIYYVVAGAIDEGGRLLVDEGARFPGLR